MHCNKNNRRMRPSAGPEMTVKTLNRTIYGLALLALSGCGSPPPAPQMPAATQEQTSFTPVALAPPPASAAGKPAPVKKQTERKATAAAPAPTAPPVQLVGMDEGAVQALLGSPVTIEDHAPGKTLRYRKNGCVLSVALYPDVQTRIFRTLSYEVTSDEHNAGAKQLCETKFGNVAAAAD